eukprot:4592964-Amphidinium_carterae.1
MARWQNIKQSEGATFMAIVRRRRRQVVLALSALMWERVWALHCWHIVREEFHDPLRSAIVPCVAASSV